MFIMSFMLQVIAISEYLLIILNIALIELSFLIILFCVFIST